MTKSPRRSSPSSVAINGFALRVIRERTGIKVADLAAALSVDRSYITKIEIGSSRRVGVDFYRRLLEHLAISDHRALLANPAFTEEVA
ncbi:helix-turn-helix domain-containing protein [Mycobacterium botniense]|uniref:helix-turn-helix domain-containing protein n=1 Tax=Mycobacterium botniense TaxID=84962 RepID=UPI0013D74588|nr:helix-turn-helix transcriptional regulator [Mycobacterium botniense]